MVGRPPAGTDPPPHGSAVRHPPRMRPRSGRLRHPHRHRGHGLRACRRNVPRVRPRQRITSTVTKTSASSGRCLPGLLHGHHSHGHQVMAAAVRRRRRRTQPEPMRAPPRLVADGNGRTTTRESVDERGRSARRRGGRPDLVRRLGWRTEHQPGRRRLYARDRRSMRDDTEQGLEWAGLTTDLPGSIVAVASGVSGRHRGAADQAERGHREHEQHRHALARRPRPCAVESHARCRPFRHPIRLGLQVNPRAHRARPRLARRAPASPPVRR